MLFVIFAVVTFVIGLFLGGFIERASYALPRGEFREIVAPKCSSCGRALPRKTFIPLVGSALLAFRCPHCGERKGLRLFLTELIYAASLLLLYVFFYGQYSFYLYAVLIAVLLSLSLIDLDIREVPHSLMLAVLGIGVLVFVFSFFTFSQADTIWWEHLVGAVVISVPLFILMMVTGGIGGGDVKLMFCLGLVLGFKLTFFAFLVGVVVAALCAIVLRLAFGKGGQYQLPLVPFLSLGTLVALLCGNAVIAAVI
ncbi:MAG TPA: hypothetical protein DIC18_02355 [Clostridiales bacterium]|nr:hypothetical protein [Clostridiales bacterium]